MHFNLFGGTVLKLGTKAHHDAMLAGIDRLDPTGCFALTELGFGGHAALKPGTQHSSSVLLCLRRNGWLFADLCEACVLAGNNAVEMQTTATLDLERDEFVIDTPTTLAQK